MDRREALKRISVLMGGAVSATTVSGILGGCRVGPQGETFVPATLSSDQNELVATIAELIIPETDTGGARAARVNEFIDKMLTDWLSDDEKNRFLAGLNNVDAVAVESGGASFVDLSNEDQTQILTGLEEARMAWRQRVASGEADRRELPFFEMIRELTIAGYYTSEIGASQELKHEMVFEAYEGDVPYSEIGRAWS